MQFLDHGLPGRLKGKAQEDSNSMGVVVGNGYPYMAILIQEVYLDLKIEGGPLMGGIHGLSVQYQVLPERWSQLQQGFQSDF